MPNWVDDEGFDWFGVLECKRCLTRFQVDSRGEVPVHRCLDAICCSTSSHGELHVVKRVVVHCKKDKFDVYIGRPSPWGNPFSGKPKSLAEVKVNSREEAIACYEEYLRQNPELVERAKRELRGKVLGCWCAPKACHGDVLARIANE